MAGPRGSTDPLYDKPYVDIDEWRDEPVRHRYVHGGFQGTDLRFSIYFPPPSATRAASSSRSWPSPAPSTPRPCRR